MRTSDWSSDVCSSDRPPGRHPPSACSTVITANGKATCPASIWKKASSSRHRLFGELHRHHRGFLGERSDTPGHHIAPGFRFQPGFIVVHEHIEIGRAHV